MLEELALRGIGVIEDARLRFGPGLTVITGETGAGKTMVLTGLGLLLGQRADTALVRRGARSADVDGVLSARAIQPLAHFAEQVGGQLDDGALLLGRSVPAQGRARAFLGGRTVPTATLAELTQRYVTVHGQGDAQRLRSPAQQRVALDEFAQSGPLLARYREAWEDLQRRTADLGRWVETSARLEAERRQLAAGLGAIDAVGPQPGEDDELRTEAERLTNVEDLREAIELARLTLGGAEMEPGVLDHLDRVRQVLAGAGRFGAELTAWADAVGEASRLLSQVHNEVAASAENLVADPARLDEVHHRRADLNALMRQYGPALDDVLAWADQARARLGELAREPATRDELVERVAEARTRATQAAQELTGARTAAATRLAALVNAELAGLAMKGATFAVSVAPAELGPWGGDDVAMTLTSHPGADPLPVGRSASGGELSRIMLALEVSLASTLTGGDLTFVFDEVDAGIGGSAALEVGRRLRALAEHHQVVVVTHLAQVAAFAGTHLVVTKHTTAHAATTEVAEVTELERQREIARMLSGEASPTAIRHAAELLQKASMGR